MSRRSSTRPPLLVLNGLGPPLRTASGNRWAVAYRIAAETSAALVGRAITAGLPSVPKAVADTG